MDSLDAQVASQRALTLDLPPSCLEFSPLLPSCFLVGTYNLQASEGEQLGTDEPSHGPQTRDGSIVIYELAGEDIVHIHTEPRPSAILDLRFQTCPGKRDILGVVSSTGTLDIFRFSSSSSGPPSLTLLGTFSLPGIGEDVLFLQFAWHPTIPDTVAITTSQGGVHILQLGPDYTTSRSTFDPIITHSLEAWAVAVSPTIPTLEQGDSSSFTIYTGGDDSVLQYGMCTIRGKLSTDDDTLDIGLPFSAMSIRGHDAGVTAILPLPCGKDIVVTGSYDDHIRVFSIQPLHETFGAPKTKLLAEANLGGGVWRLRLIKHESGGQGGGANTWRALVLASCMHAGARIVQLKGADDNGGEVVIEVLGRFEEHRSMNYASDFRPGSEVGDGGKLVCISTSFYDKLLCLWSIELK